MKINFEIPGWCQKGEGKKGPRIDVNLPPVDVGQAEFDRPLPGMVSKAQPRQLIECGEKGIPNSMDRRPARATQLSIRVSSLGTIALLAMLALPLSDKTSATSASAQQPAKQSDSHPGPSAPSHVGALAGESVFSTNCSGCHGLDGQGSERAPGIAGSAKMQRLSDEQLVKIVSNGVAGTGMPAFQALGDDKVLQIVSYLRVLQGKTGPRSLAGDPTRGKEIFFGKGECSSCHRIYGAGGFLGPDLSTYSPGVSAQAILDGILTVDRVVPAGYRVAIVTTRDGQRFEGIARNEDNFSLQLQSKDGSFHFFEKSALASLEHPNQSLMPTNYRQRLSPDELNDVVNYLVNGGISQKPARVHQNDNNQGEEDFQ
jgi:putative heme-binding domain-containing protein